MYETRPRRDEYDGHDGQFAVVHQAEDAFALAPRQVRVEDEQVGPKAAEEVHAAQGVATGRDDVAAVRQIMTVGGEQTIIRIREQNAVKRHGNT